MGGPGASSPGAYTTGQRETPFRGASTERRYWSGPKPGHNLMQFVDTRTVYADRVSHPARFANHKMLGRGGHCQPPFDGPGRGRAPPPPHHIRRTLCPFPPSPRTRPRRQNRARTTPMGPPPRAAARGTQPPRARSDTREKGARRSRATGARAREERSPAPAGGRRRRAAPKARRRGARPRDGGPPGERAPGRAAGEAAFRPSR